MTRRGWQAGLAFLALLGLAACIGRAPSYHSANWQTPKDPPPIPARKPAVPATFDWQRQNQGLAASGEVQSAAIETASLSPLPAETQAAQPLAAAAATPGRHRVALGETLYAVSRTYGLPIRTLIDANGLAPPYALQAGQVLTVPSPRIHVVRSGDTAYGVSRAYGVDLRELARLNRIQAPYTIALGQKLVLPAARREAAPAAVPVAVPESQLAAVPQAQPVPSELLTPEPGLPPLPKRRPGNATGTQTAALPAPAVKIPAPSKPQAIPRPPPRAGSKFLWPVNGRVIGSFGPKSSGQHNDGINISAPRGTPVVAAENGVVVFAGSQLKGFGRLLLLKHAEGWVTAYGHNDRLLVEKGQTVRRGQAIARVGSSGSVRRPQLHFEVRKGTQAVEPTKHLTRQKNASAQ